MGGILLSCANCLCNLGAINPNSSFESPAQPLLSLPSPELRQWQSCRQCGQVGTGVSDAAVPGDSFPWWQGEGCLCAGSTGSHWAQQLQRGCCGKGPQVLSLTPSPAQQRTDANAKRVVNTDLAGWSFTDTSPWQHLFLRGWKVLQGSEMVRGQQQDPHQLCTAWLVVPPPGHRAQLSQHTKCYSPPIHYSVSSLPHREWVGSFRLWCELLEGVSNGGFLLCSTELSCHPGSALSILQHPALGRIEAVNQKLASTEPKTHQGIHNTISEESVPIYKLSVESDRRKHSLPSWRWHMFGTEAVRGKVRSAHVFTACTALCSNLLMAGPGWENRAVLVDISSVGGWEAASGLDLPDCCYALAADWDMSWESPELHPATAWLSTALEAQGGLLHFITAL